MNENENGFGNNQVLEISDIPVNESFTERGDLPDNVPGSSTNVHMFSTIPINKFIRKYKIDGLNEVEVNLKGIDPESILAFTFIVNGKKDLFLIKHTKNILLNLAPKDFRIGRGDNFLVVQELTDLRIETYIIGRSSWIVVYILVEDDEYEEEKEPEIINKPVVVMESELNRRKVNYIPVPFMTKKLKNDNFVIVKKLKLNECDRISKILETKLGEEVRDKISQKFIRKKFFKGGNLTFKTLIRKTLEKNKGVSDFRYILKNLEVLIKIGSDIENEIIGDQGEEKIFLI